MKKPMRNLKIFPKTFLYTIGLMSLIVLSVHGLVYFLLPSFYMEEKQKELSMRMDALTDILQKADSKQSETIAQNYAIQQNANIIVKIGNREHRYQGFTPVDIYFDPADMKEPEAEFTIGIQSGGKDRLENYSIIAQNSSFVNADGQQVELYLVISIQPIAEAKQVVFKILPYSVAVSIFVSLAAAYVYSRAMTKPIQKILGATKEMEKLQKNASCPVETQDEIGMIAENINDLYKTLWATIESLEQKAKDISQVEQEKVEFLRSASHELKTPLTALNILLENMRYKIGKYKDRETYLEQAQEMTLELSRMVHQILSASKLQAGQGQREDVDVRETLQEVLEAYKILARAKELKLQVELEETCLLHIHKESFKKVLSNILSNAINYTENRKNIHVQIKDGQIIIENECEPLPEEVLQKVFKAFYRPDFSRARKDGGTGLGLYIVDSILSSEGIPFSFKPSDLGMRFIMQCGQAPKVQ